jgi:SAM-dependent methyltransferase
MNDNSRRPFYAEYAWAYDLIVDRPVCHECATIAAWLAKNNVLPGAALLDAGCGTGRYAIELARRGYTVHGIDLSPELVQIAKASLSKGQDPVSFAVGDILSYRAEQYNAILCRGVLNDLVDDHVREAAFDGFAGCLQPRGVLILDVREWQATAERKAREPVFRKKVSTYRGELTFTSTTKLDPERRLLRISEEHAIVHAGQLHVSEYQFVMRCWTSQELRSALAQHGFGNVKYFGAYDARIAPGVTDRLVAVAQLSEAAS